MANFTMLWESNSYAFPERTSIAEQSYDPSNFAATTVVTNNSLFVIRIKSRTLCIDRIVSSLPVSGISTVKTTPFLQALYARFAEETQLIYVYAIQSSGALLYLEIKPNETNLENGILQKEFPLFKNALQCISASIVPINNEIYAFVGDNLETIHCISFSQQNAPIDMGYLSTRGFLSSSKQNKVKGIGYIGRKLLIGFYADGTNKFFDVSRKTLLHEKKWDVSEPIESVSFDTWQFQVNEQENIASVFYAVIYNTKSHSSIEVNYLVLDAVTKNSIKSINQVIQYYVDEIPRTLGQYNYISSWDTIALYTKIENHINDVGILSEGRDQFLSNYYVSKLMETVEGFIEKTNVPPHTVKQKLIELIFHSQIFPQEYLYKILTSLQFQIADPTDLKGSLIKEIGSQSLQAQVNILDAISKACFNKLSESYTHGIIIQVKGQPFEGLLIKNESKILTRL